MSLKAKWYSKLSWFVLPIVYNWIRVSEDGASWFGLRFWLSLVMIGVLAWIDYKLTYLNIVGGQFKGRNGLLFPRVEGQVSDIQKIAHREGFVSSLVLTVNGKDHTFIEMEKLDEAAHLLEELTGKK